MQSFLGLAARQIFDSYSLNELQHLQIILPSRRAALYFKRELSALSGIPFFSPGIQSIDDFIHETSGLQNIDPIELYFETFAIWKSLDQTQSFEKFLTWVPTLIRDYNLIDSSLIEKPERLFSYMSEAEVLSRWELGTDTYEFSDNSINYFSFFSKMAKTYELLREKLLERGQSYPGLAYRSLAENLEKLDDLPIKHFHFVGLNALSIAEEKIVEYLVKKNRASCLWDSDTYYMNSNDKAGRKLRKYKASKRFGKDWDFIGNALETSSKSIEIFELNSKVLQAKLAFNLAQKSTLDSHAMVVLDENDFNALFVQLPALDKKFNVSAGITFKATHLSAIVDLYERIFEFDGSNVKVSYVKSLFNNTLFKTVVASEIGEDALEDFLKELYKQSQLYIKKSYLVSKLNESKVIQGLLTIKVPYDFIHSLKQFIAVFTPLELEEMPFGYLLIEKLELLEIRVLQNTDLNLNAFRILLKELIKGLSVPFEKEPTARLQIMSMLETRCLDFKEITFLAFEEGNLPSGKKNNSFIPFDAAQSFGLPLYSDQDAIMAYHFWRLLQRAEKVNIIYVQSIGTGISKSEPSRFLAQIENDLVEKNPHIVIDRPKISFEGETKWVNPITVAKTPEIMEKVKFFLEKQGVSATALTAYYKSELGFYWRYIEKVKMKEDDTADIGNDTFGSIVHYILEKADDPYIQNKALITKEILQNQKRFVKDNFDRLLKENQPDFEFNYGLNTVLRSVVYELIMNYYNMRIQTFTRPFYILGVEKQFVRYIDVNGVKMKVLGNIDKLEKHDDRVVIIDYKTGKVDNNKIKINKEEFIDQLRNDEADKLRQLCLYNFLLGEEYGDQLEFRFYSFRDLKGEFVLDTGDYARKEILDGMEEFLRSFAEKLLNTDIDFSHDSSISIPDYLDYKNLLLAGK